MSKAKSFRNWKTHQQPERTGLCFYPYEQKPGDFILNSIDEDLLGLFNSLEQAKAAYRDLNRLGSYTTRI